MKQYTRSLFILLVLLLLGLPIATTYAAPGDLDPTFDGDGKLNTSIGTGQSRGWAVVHQPDGKIVVVSPAASGSMGSNPDFALARFLPNGALDPAFDGDGTVLVDFGVTNDRAFALALQPDGKLVVAGFTATGSTRRFALIRLHPDGSLDSTFDGDGRVILTTPTIVAEAFAVAVQPDGKIVAAGSAKNTGVSSHAVVRLNADGTLDSTFDGDGIVVSTHSVETYARQVIVQPDGTIVYGGGNAAARRFYALRYLPTGTPDSTFGTAGVAQSTIIGAGGSPELSGLVLQSDGKIITSGTGFNGANTDFAVVRFHPNGTLDSSFGTDGERLIPLGSNSADSGWGLTLQSDSKLVMAGTYNNISGSPTGSEFGVIRLNPDGTLDLSFSGDGIVITDGLGFADSGEAVSVDASGKILVAGQFTDQFGGRLALVRYEGVANLPPSVNANGPYLANEGTPITLEASGSDPEGTTLLYEWDLDNNGTYEQPGASVSFAKDDGPATVPVSVRVTDAGGLTAIASTTVTVANVAPTATLVAPATVEESSSFTLALTGSVDPSTADTTAGLEYAFDCGAGYGAFGTGDNTTCITVDNGVLTIGARIKDKDGGLSEYIAPVSVLNVAPTATLTAPTTVEEGASFTLTMTNPVDPSPSDTGAGFEYAFDCGTGYGAFGTIDTVPCTTTDNGTLTVRAQIRDKDGGVSEQIAPVIVQNVAPTTTVSTPTQIDEGSTFQIALTNPLDPSPADTSAGFRYAFDCGTGYGVLGTEPNVTCPATDDGTLTVRAQIWDKDDGMREMTAQVVVMNIAPTLGGLTIPTQAVLVGDTVTVTAPYTDPGVLDTHIVVVEWGDGTTSAGSTLNGLARGTHAYTTAGNYTVTLTLTDDDGGVATVTNGPITVNNTTTNKIVAGAGTFTSPAGAYPAAPNATGHATFAFAAAYPTGASVPLGSATLHFPRTNFRFIATSLRSLAVTGNFITIEGRGRVNGAGDYAFRITALDTLRDGTPPDRFRIRIWNRSTGALVYDNEPTADAGTPPTTPIQSGAIVIYP